jgi:hypothetical protein
MMGDLVLTERDQPGDGEAPNLDQRLHRISAPVGTVLGIIGKPLAHSRGDDRVYLDRTATDVQRNLAGAVQRRWQIGSPGRRSQMWPQSARAPE